MLRVFVCPYATLMYVCVPPLLASQGDYFVLRPASPAEGAIPSPTRVVEAAHPVFLSPSHLSTLAHALRSASLAAPGAMEAAGGTHRLLPLPDFIGVVSRLACAGKLPPAWPHLTTPALAALGSQFCPGGAGQVDWQALCVALCVSCGPEGPTGAVAAPTPEQVAVLREAFAALDAEGKGSVSVEDCDAIELWFEQTLPTPPALAALEKQQARAVAALGKEGPRGGNGWHNVTREHGRRGEWRKDEEGRMQATAAALAQEQRLLVCGGVRVGGGRGVMF